MTKEKEIASEIVDQLNALKEDIRKTTDAIEYDA
jgi:hypothetical protein